jgi:prepilin-type N-terminal cleavage/methylation domain-containing protein
MKADKISRQSGFSLAEIILAIIIAGVLASLAIPAYFTSVERSRSSEGKQILYALLQAQKAYQIDTGAYTATLTNLDVSFGPIANFNAPTVAAADPIAQITRSTGTYRLSMYASGTITCTNLIGSPCASLNF